MSKSLAFLAVLCYDKTSKFLGFGTAVSGTKGGGMQQPLSPPPRRSMSPDQPNPAEPITESPSTIIGRTGWALRTLLLCELK